MQPITPTTTITLDDVNFEVAKMSKEIQDLVAYFDDWRQKELDAASELLMVRSALEHIRTRLLTAIQKEREEALQKAQALGIIPGSETVESSNERE